MCSNFDNVILVYNSANPMELGFINDYDQIRAAIWCQGPGNVGFEALGKILSGEVNPSGKTSDTFIYDIDRQRLGGTIGKQPIILIWKIWR